MDLFGSIMKFSFLRPINEFFVQILDDDGLVCPKEITINEKIYLRPTALFRLPGLATILLSAS